jgi:hypothetical protein
MNHIHDEIIGMSYSWFSNREITPESLYEFINMMRNAFSNQQLDEELLFTTLESIHSVSIEADPSTLTDHTNHIEWFNPDTNASLNRNLDWHYWVHYRDYLYRMKNWNRRIVDSLDRFSSIILSYIEDPIRDGSWDRRGVVVGSVQSGKTANYTALITKAADAGYKLIIVLAGVHNSLRSQTQYRINEEFLGYDLQTMEQLTGAVTRHIGVGRMFQDHRAVYTLTHSGEDGDFRQDARTRGGVIPSVDAPPIILIIKKHVTIMKNLIGWISNIIAEPDEHRVRSVRDIPLLLIDDECDYASVNNRNPERDENGQVIQEWEPSMTNLRIRQLLNLFQKSAYVGYSATPFANIFIHHDDPHPSFGEDLFPRSFIVSLPQPSNYIGPDKLFGIDDSIDVQLEDGTEPLPLIRVIDDNDNIIPGGHRQHLEITVIPESLLTALKSFMLVCATRRIRQQGTPHNSMLIHVTRYTAVQQQVYDLVQTELSNLMARIMSGSDPLDDFREIWEIDFQTTSNEMSELGYQESQIHNWDDVREILYESARRVRVRLLNGMSTDTLDYRDAEINVRNLIQDGEEVPWFERGASVIAIGGDKLSRGLTLDGLSISYYLRVSTMYDTLMQMGRWFGYRDGYNDLCRIYITEELRDWYSFIAGSMVELKNELNYMALQNTDPLHFGLRVRNHPGRLAITSAQKRRDAEMIQISFAGRSQETVVFDPQYLENNRIALENLIHRLDPSGYLPVDQNKPRFQWKRVPAETVMLFLREYRTHDEAAVRVNPAFHADFIETQTSIDELIEWDVVIISRTTPHHTITIADIEIGCVTRNATDIRDDKISIRRLLSPVDQLLDLTYDELLAARIQDGLDVEGNAIPRPNTIRRVRPPERGLLIIYVCHGERDERTYGHRGNEVIGYGLSFPYSENTVPTEFLANPVYIDLQ